MYFSEPSICASLRNRSLVDQTPIVGQLTRGPGGGSVTTYRSGPRFAGYQLSAAVSAPGRARSAIWRSHSGFSPGAGPSHAHSRKNRQLSRGNTSSATPGNWNHSMYQDHRSCVSPAAAPAPWCPTDSTVSRSTRSGRRNASCQARPAPQSCPTTAALATPTSASTATTSSRSRSTRYASTPAGRLDLPYPRRSGATTRYPAAASAPIWYRQTCHESGEPCSRSTGAPCPAGAAVVEAASTRAATVPYRPNDNRGTGVDTVTAHYLLARADADPLLDKLVRR